MSLAQAAALLPRIEKIEGQGRADGTTLPETKVVRPIFRSAGNAALNAHSEASEPDLADRRAAGEQRMIEALRQIHGPAPLRVVEDD
jgi:hypothetical protein